eukprot:CAMPEP_0201516658 /NCGR_PEP_ID=MMETSP0161_2-20130828/7935_1 /ASSEMBLY_ACC=CAM_ASM_000251 /TAXON_ID=180227 /ORGANISM="Neoparamoeba aestuarina, Strain SoJaBio B1-5/56/2" /LENGTH=734 /DNA_ID=CAMNT_0047913877 /DNA_START=30 /DNA_END=2234 /DNA_ORIENTATION=+
MVSALHPVGTCAMPQRGANEQNSCSDGELRVRGVQGLRVADASAFATQVDGNPTEMILTIGERLAEMLKKEYYEPAPQHATIIFQQEFHELSLENLLSIAAQKYKETTVTFPGFPSLTFKLATDAASGASGNYTSKLINPDSVGLTSAILQSWVIPEPFLALRIAITIETKSSQTKTLNQVADDWLSFIATRVEADYLKEFGTSCGSSGDLPLFNEAIADPSENTGGPRPGSAERPYVFVFWRQNFPTVPISVLWPMVGHWRGEIDGKTSTLPGSMNSFQLPGLPRMFEYVVMYSNERNTFIYRMERTEPPGQPGVDYIATKKAVTYQGEGSAWLRSASLLVDSINATHGQTLQAGLNILHDVFVSGGRRYEPGVNYQFVGANNADRKYQKDFLYRPARENGNGKNVVSAVTQASPTIVAAFDIDGTIIRPKSGAAFSRDENDWEFVNGYKTVESLQALSGAGANIVFLSNQRGLLKYNKVTQWQKKMDQVLEAIGLPIPVLGALTDDFSKPGPGLWLYYSNYINPGAKASESQYCGDEDGETTPIRGKDGKPSDKDKKFAENTGLKFINPQTFTATDGDIGLRKLWHVSQSVTVKKPVEAVWEIISGFFTLPLWNPVISDSYPAENPNASSHVRRVVVFPDPPSTTIEELTAVTESPHSYSYKWVEGHWGERFTDYHSRILAIPVDDDAATVVQWSGHFYHNSKDDVVAFYRQGLDCLADDECLAKQKKKVDG